MPRKRRRSTSAFRQPRIHWGWLFLLFILFFAVFALYRTPKGIEIRESVAESVRTARLPVAAHSSDARPIEVYFAPGSREKTQEIDDAFLDLLKSAKRSLACAIYDLEWEIAADALIAQHKRGVRVRIASDSEYGDRDAIKRCMAVGIPVTFDQREPFMHNKFVVVDDKTVWTGSTNITQNCLFRNNNNSLRIESPELAKNFTSEFEELFAGQHGKRSPSTTPFPDVTVGQTRIECYFAPEDNVQDQIIGEIAAARESICFMAFSFTSEPIAKALEQRMIDGVNVSGLFEERNAGSQYSRDEWLKDRGATVLLDANKYTMHHKVMTIDGRTVVTGSYNFSKAAETQNDENVIVIHDRALAGRFLAEYDRLMGQARLN